MRATGSIGGSFGLLDLNIPKVGVLGDCRPNFVNGTQFLFSFFFSCSARGDDFEDNWDRGDSVSDIVNSIVILGSFEVVR